MECESFHLWSLSWKMFALYIILSRIYPSVAVLKVCSADT